MTTPRCLTGTFFWITTLFVFFASAPLHAQSPTAGTVLRWRMQVALAGPLSSPPPQFA